MKTENKQPKIIAVIVPYCNTDQTRLPALYNLLDCIKAQDFYVTDRNNERTQEKAYEVIFVEQKNTVDYKSVDTKGLVDKHIIVEHIGEFNKSWVMNVAARNTDMPLLVFTDADMLFGAEYLSFTNVWRETNFPRPKFFVGWDWIIKLPGRDEPIARMVRHTALTAGGVFWVEKDFYWEIGGMNENYFGYGAEDNDFWVRANITMGKKGLKNVLNTPYPMAHTYHHNVFEPSPKRFYFLDRTIQYPEKVIAKLKAQNLGNPVAPTLCDFSDIILKEEGIQNKGGKGLI